MIQEGNEEGMRETQRLLDDIAIPSGNNEDMGATKSMKLSDFD